MNTTKYVSALNDINRMITEDQDTIIKDHPSKLSATARAKEILALERVKESINSCVEEVREIRA